MSADDGECRAPAVGGPCVLPRGHNMGNLDIPSNHKWEARPTEVERLTTQLQAAQATIAEMQAWEVAQRVDHSKHVHAEDSLVACPEMSWQSVEARDVAAILNRAAPAALTERETCQAKAEGWDEAILRFEDALGYETRQVAMRDNPYRASIGQAEADRG